MIQNSQIISFWLIKCPMVSRKVPWNLDPNPRNNSAIMDDCSCRFMNYFSKLFSLDKSFCVHTYSHNPPPHTHTYAHTLISHPTDTHFIPHTHTHTIMIHITISSSVSLKKSHQRNIQMMVLMTNLVLTLLILIIIEKCSSQGPEN